MPITRSLPLAAAAGLVLATVATDARSPARAQTSAPVVELWTWGDNRAGQLGNVPPSHAIPWPMHESARWTKVVAGDSHVLAVDDVGQLWAWGGNGYGQLGIGSYSGTILPVAVPGMTGITLVAAGAHHSLAYRSTDDTVWAWGDNASGQIGRDPSVTAYAPSPLQVSVLGAVKALAAGGQHSLAVTTGGALYAWGSNGLGQLGLLDYADRSTPTLVPTLSGVSTVGAGGSHSLAVVGPSNDVWAWGWNVFGQLGSGVQGTPDVGVNKPQPVAGVAGIAQVAGGDFHSVALGANGRIWAWGYNTEGQVGNGDITPANIGVLRPSLLTAITDVAAIAASALQTLARKSNGEVWVWGAGTSGACGNNTRTDQRLPVKVIESGGTAIASGRGFSVALAPARVTTSVVVLGDPGTDTTLALTRPVTRAFTLPTSVAGMAAGLHHGLLLDASHRVWAFGDNASGQLGAAGPAAVDPVLVSLPLGATRGFVQVAARGNHAFALRADGKVFAWGDDAYGQLGTGDTATAPVAPFAVTGLPQIVAIAAGERHTLALDQGGSVWGWGSNIRGQVGVAPSATPVTRPVQLQDVYGTSEIAAGGYHSLAINTAGRLSAWGSGFLAQHGDDSLSDHFRPNPVSGFKSVVSMTAGRFHSFAVLDGGEVWAFGDPSFGQLGNGSAVPYWTPVKTQLGSAALVVAAGEHGGVAVDADGTVSTWGDDSRGQLGREGPNVPHYANVPAAASVTNAVMAASGGTFTIVATK